MVPIRATLETRVGRLWGRKGEEGRERREGRGGKGEEGREKVFGVGST
jgi:hypothetical protein